MPSCPTRDAGSRPSRAAGAPLPPLDPWLADVLLAATANLVECADALASAVQPPSRAVTTAGALARVAGAVGGGGGGEAAAQTRSLTTLSPPSMSGAAAAEAAAPAAAAATTATVVDHAAADAVETMSADELWGHCVAFAGRFGLSPLRQFFEDTDTLSPVTNQVFCP